MGLTFCQIRLKDIFSIKIIIKTSLCFVCLIHLCLHDCWDILPTHFYPGRCISSLMYNWPSWAGFEIQQMSNRNSFIRLTWADPDFHLSSLTSLYWSLSVCCIHLQFSFLVFHAEQRPCVYTHKVQESWFNFLSHVKILNNNNNNK